MSLLDKAVLRDTLRQKTEPAVEVNKAENGKQKPRWLA